MILANLKKETVDINGNRLRRYTFHMVRVNEREFSIHEITRTVTLVTELKYNKDGTATRHHPLQHADCEFLSKIAAAAGYAGQLRLEVI